MKYKKLIIHNIASIADAEINFESEPLLSTSIFVITGETGVGKSTILDAICLALYNRVPKLESSDKAKYLEPDFGKKKETKNEENAIHNGSTDDKRQMVRRGESDAFSTLEFVGNDGESYRATWSVEKKKNGEYKDTNRGLESMDGKLKLDKKTEIDGINKNGKGSKIVEIVGLTYEQFCKTSMLAQGEFTNFLKANDDEKSSILEKLTLTDKYTKIGMKIYEKFDKVGKEKEDLEKKCRNIVLLTDEEKDEKRKEISQTNENVKGKEQEFLQLEKKLQWIVDGRAKESELKTESEKLIGFKNRLEEEETKENLKMMKDWERCEDVRQCLIMEDKAVENQNENKKKYEELRKRLDELQCGELFERKELDDKKKKIEENENFLRSEQGNVKIYDNSQSIESWLLQYQGGEEKIKNCQSKAEILAKQKDEYGSNMKKEECEEEVIKKEEAAFANEIEAKNAEIRTMDESGLEERRSVCDSELTVINESQLTLIRYENTQKSLEDSQKKRDDLRREITQYNQTMEEKKKQEKILELSFEEKKRVYENMKERASDMAKALRVNLKEGDICPVCGNKIKSLVVEEEFLKVLKPSQDAYEAEEKKLIDVRKDYATAEERLEEKKQEEKEQELSQEKLRVEIGKDKKCCEETLSKLKIEFTYETERLNEKLNDRKREIEKEKQQVGELQKRVNGMKDELEKIRKEKEFRQKKLEEVRGRINQYKVEQSKTMENLKNNEDTMESCRNDLDKISAQLNNYFPDEKWRENVEVTRQFLKGRTEKYNRAKEEKEKLMQEANKKKEMLDRLDLLLEDLRNSAISMPPKKEEDLEKRVNDCVIEMRTVKTLIDEEGKKVETYRKEVQKFLQQHTEVDEMYLRKLTTLTSEWIAKTRNDYTQLNDDMKKCEGRLATLQNDLKRHEESELKLFCEGEGEKQIIERKEDVGTQKNEMMLKIASLNNDLIQDEKNRLQHEKLLEEKEKCERVYKKWEELNDMYGGKDGKKFKTIAQAHVLQNLLHEANLYLDKLTKRYRLECQMDTYAIFVNDYFQGGAKRPVSTLSGGESFMISLAMALGLSKLAGATLTSDIVFIDEGFGTLSAEALEPVMEMLSEMNRLNGKKVGVISHVEMLKQRIPVHIQVEREGQSSPSEVKVCMAS